MKVVCNGEELELREGACLDEAIAAIGYAQRAGIAAAIGDRVVPRSRWRDEALGDGDRVTVIRAVQGG